MPILTLLNGVSTFANWYPNYNEDHIDEEWELH